MHNINSSSSPQAMVNSAIKLQFSQKIFDFDAPSEELPELNHSDSELFEDEKIEMPIIERVRRKPESRSHQISKMDISPIFNEDNFSQSTNKREEQPPIYAKSLQ